MLSIKVIIICLFVYVNGLNIAHVKAVSRYRKSIVFNLANSIQNKPCPLLEHFQNKGKKAYDISNKEDEILEILIQEGEVSMLE
tara:strand:+ start:350 stop:601 length:252 start_codon:yes stop_codon:yes gene_type:complete